MWCGSKMSKPLRYQSFTSIDPLFLRIDMLLKQVETPWHSTEWHSRRDIGCPCQPFASFPEGCAPISAMGSGGSVVSAAEKATTEEVREAFAALGPGEQKKAPGGCMATTVWVATPCWTAWSLAVWPESTAPSTCWVTSSRTWISRSCPVEVWQLTRLQPPSCEKLLSCEKQRGRVATFK